MAIVGQLAINEAKPATLPIYMVDKKSNVPNLDMVEPSSCEPDNNPAWTLNT